MTSAWTDDLHKARGGCELAGDRLILHFTPMAKRFAVKFGGFRDPTELEGELYLNLVETIRYRINRMKDDHLERLVSAHLFYCVSHFIRREKKRMGSQLVRNGMAYDQHQSQIEIDDMIDQLDERQKTVARFLLDGWTITEISNQLELSRKTVYAIQKQVQDALQEIISE